MAFKLRLSRLYFLNFLIFIFGCTGSSIAVQAFGGERGLLSSCGAQALHCGGFSCCRAQALEHSGSVVGAHRLSCSSTCRVEPRSPPLAGRFFTTEPPGKPKTVQNLSSVFLVINHSKGQLCDALH